MCMGKSFDSQIYAIHCIICRQEFCVAKGKQKHKRFMNNERFAEMKILNSPATGKKAKFPHQLTRQRFFFFLFADETSKICKHSKLHFSSLLVFHLSILQICVTNLIHLCPTLISCGERKEASCRQSQLPSIMPTIETSLSFYDVAQLNRR